MVDIAFETNIPRIYDAVKILSPNSAGKEVFIEVLQQLQDGVVRGIAMDSTDGLRR